MERKKLLLLKNHRTLGSWDKSVNCIVSWEEKKSWRENGPKDTVECLLYTGQLSSSNMLNSWNLTHFVTLVVLWIDFLLLLLPVSWWLHQTQPAVWWKGKKEFFGSCSSPSSSNPRYPDAENNFVRSPALSKHKYYNCLFKKISLHLMLCSSLQWQ